MQCWNGFERPAKGHQLSCRRVTLSRARGQTFEVANRLQGQGQPFAQVRGRCELGHGAEPHSTQVPLLIDLAKKRGCATHAGPGENVWSNVHIDDLVALYVLAIESAPPGAFLFAENGENSMREVCEAINRMLGFTGPPVAMSMEQAASEWGEGTAEDTMASNSRVRGTSARQLGWKPKARGLIEEIEQGCYR